MNDESRKELLTADEAADYLNVSKATTLKWARKGKCRGRLKSAEGAGRKVQHSLHD